MKTKQNQIKFKKNNHSNDDDIQNLRKVIMLIMVPALLTSCTQSDPIVCNFGFTSLSKDKLENKTWKRSCFQVEDEAGNPSFFDEFYNFSGDRFIFSSIKYSDPNCSARSEISSKQMSGSYDVHENSKIVLNYDSFLLGFHDEHLVEENNQLGFCGLNDWQVDIFKDVEGLSCGEQGDDSISYSDSTVTLMTQISETTSDLKIEGEWYRLHVEVQEEY
jgi:hypothetical protein